MSEEQVKEFLLEGKIEHVIKYLYRFSGRVKKYVIENNGTKDDALDIFQEALVIFCQKVNDRNFTLTSKPETFLYGIAKNLWRNESRKKGLPEFDLKEEQSLNENQYATAESVFKKLSDSCKKILSDFYIKQLTMLEIAQLRSLRSEKIAKDRKYKCLAKARKMYQAVNLNF